MNTLKKSLIGMYLSIFLYEILKCIKTFFPKYYIFEIRISVVVSITILIILNTISYIKNINESRELFVNEEYDELKKRMKIIKYSFIPVYIFYIIKIYYLVNGLIAMENEMNSTLQNYSAGNGWIAIFSFFAMAPVFMISYITKMFSLVVMYTITVYSSTYGIKFITGLKRQNKIGTVSMIIHIMLQFLFIIDIIDTIYLDVKYKNKKEI